ncbi:MAG: hypothetical protein Q8O31_04205 [Rhodocyclaceae bacterium]|nr:hypothetical protein [Rhodocyclaceae bacterium]
MGTRSGCCGLPPLEGEGDCHVLPLKGREIGTALPLKGREAATTASSTHYKPHRAIFSVCSWQ